MNASPIPRSPASSLKWLWWWSLAHLAEAAVAIRGRVTGLPANRPHLTDPSAPFPGHPPLLSPRWSILPFAGLAAYGAGLLLGWLLRMQVA